MIWQLMKRDGAWKFTPWLALAFAAFGHGTGMLVLFPMLVVPTWLATQMFLRCTLYEAALPMRERELWLSKVVSRLALLWIPVIAAAAVTIVVPNRSLITLLEATAIWTVILLGLARLQIRELRAQSTLWIAGTGLLVLGVCLIPLLTSRYGSSLPPAGVMGICGIASAALFAWCWAAVPGAFQVAPAKTDETETYQEAAASRFKWSPVFSSVYGWNCAMPLATAFLMAFGQIGTGFIYVPIHFAMTLTLGRWLTSIPLAANRLFRITIAPMVAGVLLGGLIHVFVRPQPYMTLRAFMVEVAGDLTMFFLLALFCEFPAWRHLSRIRNWVRFVPMVAGVGVLAVLPIFTNEWVFDRAARYLADQLPGDWLLFGLALTVPVALTYWIAERTFGEQEYSSFFPTSKVAA